MAEFPCHSLEKKENFLWSLGAEIKLKTDSSDVPIEVSQM